MRHTTRRALPGWALLLAVTAAGGCGDPTTYGEVTGTVTKDGRALADVLVQFLPDPAKGTRGPTSQAVTDKEGRYRLQSMPVGKRQARDGAAVGWHAVVLVDQRLSGVKQGEAAPTPRVPAAYGSSATTPLKFEVKEGVQTIDLLIK